VDFILQTRFANIETVDINCYDSNTPVS